MRPIHAVAQTAAAFVCLLAAATASAQRAQPTDPAAVDRGQKIYGGSCAKCHGADTRGTDTGPDLVRSLVVLHDRMNNLHGAELAPILQTPPHHFSYDPEKLADLSQFLIHSVNKTLRSGYSNQPTNLLNGDAHAGEAFFNGAGGCAKCHSTTGDLAGIGKRYTPANLQQKFLFPNAGPHFGKGVPPARKTQVTVTLPSGKSISGSLIHLDDFTVALRDDHGDYQSFTRAPAVKVTTVDPYAAHVALLDRYTDADIHNLTTYLETLQ
jgi:cytochrome c oxidase cbb3-type subunit 3